MQVSTPGGIVEWAASDGRKGKLMGPGKTRAYGEVERTATSEKGAQAVKGRQVKKNDNQGEADDDAGEDENPHGFTKEEDEKMIEWRIANDGKPWQTFADDIGKTKEQCRERFKHIQPKDFGEKVKAQKGGDGGGGGGGGQQNQQQEKKLTKKEKKAMRQGGGGGQNKNQAQGNVQNNGQNNDGGAQPFGNSIAGQNDNDNMWGGFDPNALAADGGSNKSDDDKNQSSDQANPWAAETDDWNKTTGNDNAGGTSAWQDTSGPGGWGDTGGGTGGSNDQWENKHGGGDAKGGAGKKDKKDKKDKKEKKNGSTKNDAWDQTNSDSGGNKPGWDSGGGDTGWPGAAASNKSGSNKQGGSVAWGSAASTKSGGTKKSAGGDGGLAVDGANDWSGSQQKPASNKGGGNDNPRGPATGDGGQDNNVQAWNTNAGDNNPTTNNDGAFGGDTWGAVPAAKSASKAPSHHHSHKSAHHHYTHGHHSTKDRAAAPLELEIKPDRTFSADDLRLVARILQQDYHMVWQRVSWRFKDKTGRTVLPEVFEKKITGRVEGQEREKGERKKRR